MTVAREACTNCRVGFVRGVAMLSAYTWEGTTVRFKDEFMRCAGCGEEFYTTDQSMAHSRAITDALRARLGFLSPAEIRRVRKAYRLTPHGLDRVLGVPKGTTRRWERGTNPPPKPAARLLWIAANDRSAFRRMAKAFSPEGSK